MMSRTLLKTPLYLVVVGEELIITANGPCSIPIGFVLNNGVIVVT